MMIGRAETSGPKLAMICLARAEIGPYMGPASGDAAKQTQSAGLASRKVRTGSVKQSQFAGGGKREIT